MARYHINPETGNPGICRATKRCRFGDIEKDHYPSQEAAQKAFEKANVVAELKAHTKVSPRPNTIMEGNLLEKVEEMEFEMIEEFAATTPQNHALLNRIIDTRAQATVDWFKKLDKLNPYKNSDSPCDKETYSSLKKDFDYFKNKTAALVEAHLESKFFKPAYEELPDPSSVGAALEKTAYDPNTPEWLRARYDSVGGSDVGCLVTMDFEDPDKIMYWDRKSLETVEKSKLALPTPEEIEKNNWLSKGWKGGPLYRGTVWEDRSRDVFTRDRPDLTVYNTKSQYYNPDRPWQQVNFDGVLSDRPDKKPNGILELKTGNDPDKWNDGPPLNYRAQVLYYLNATKLDFCEISVTLNDGATKSFRLNKNDPVAPGRPGGNISMETYIKNRVEPWFEELKTRRAA